MTSSITEHNNPLGKKAIVIGGSIAGKLAARVLANFYQEVLIIEKDQKSEKDITRKGVPQGSHGHALLKSGKEMLEELFPGIIDELINDGSVTSDFASELSWYHHGSWKTKFHAGISLIQQSRPFLEWHIQRRLELIPNISYLYGYKAKRFLTNQDHSIVTGIVVEKVGDQDTEHKADLVVDASGAGSNSPNMLKQIGYNAPAKTEIKVDLSYSSRIYHAPSSIKKAWKGLLVYPNPPGQNRGGGISSIENQRWMVTLLGYGVQSPPSNDKEFLAFAKSLEKPDVYEAIIHAEPLTDVSVYRFPALRRFHYEKMNRFPNSLIVIGDAFGRIDPVFAQGMSISAFEALALKKALQRALTIGMKQFPQRFHRSVSKIIDVPWLIALTEDFRFTHTSGKKPFGLSFLQWYVKKVILGCSYDSSVYLRFIEVLHLKAHPIALFHPLTIKSVLFPSKPRG
jgi:2-polyprenyl-6-methoxyphenol hydroxylase-like FAD-dependent oxidoreductase